MSVLTPEAVVQMNLSECQSEALDRWKKAQEISDRWPNGLTEDESHEDYNQRKQLESEIDLLETRSAKLEDAQSWKDRVKDNVKRYTTPASGHRQPEGDDVGPRGTKDFGSQFVESKEYKQQLESGIFASNNMTARFDVKLDGSLLDYLTRKALVYSGSGVGGPLIRNERVDGIAMLQRDIVLLDMIPTAQTTSNMIEYFEETTFTNNAAEVAESSVTTGTTGTKPESALGYTLRTSPVATIAHWVPVTNQMLADAPAIEGIIRNRLLLGLNLRLETEIINGDGNSPNLRGILNTANVQTLGLGTDSIVDAAYKAMNQVMVTGLANPSGFVFHPNDWQAVRLSRENAATGTLGGYLYGPPSVAGPQTLWGRPVALAIGMPENTLLVGDFALGSMLFEREQGVIRVGTINDQMIRNQQTILAELRAALTVFRPTAFARVTGV